MRRRDAALMFAVGLGSVFGEVSGRAAALELLPALTLQSPNEQELGFFGHAVAQAGDVDGDGVPDLVIGNPGGNVTAGRVHLLSGADGSLLETLLAPDVEAASDFGRSLAVVGDLDGDGVADLLVGARITTEPPGAGRAYAFTSNAPPVADAGPDQGVECAGPAGTAVTLDGSGSSDPNGDPLTYTWLEGATVLAGPTASATVEAVLALGVHSITLVVEDGFGGSDSDETVVAIEDTTPPTILVETPPQQLWPPNHGHRTVALADLELMVADSCDGGVSKADLLLVQVGNDEPEDGPFDGNTLQDIVIAADCRSASLRAERQGTGNGRVYTLTLAVADASQNVAGSQYAVHVPVGVGDAVVDDGVGAGYTVAGCTVPWEPVVKLSTPARQGLFAPPVAKKPTRRSLVVAFGSPASRHRLRCKSLSAFGLRRRGPICGVGPPRRCPRIACVGPPCIWTHGARNAGILTFTTGS